MLRTALAACCRRAAFAAALGCAAVLGALPASSQELQTVDPNTVIDGDLANPQQAEPAPAAPAQGQNATPGFSSEANSALGAAGELPPTGSSTYAYQEPQVYSASPATGDAANPSPTPANRTGTYSAAELLPAAEGVFGKGARGLGEMIQDLLKKQGQPDAYIVGKEAGGAFMFGLRYGAGTLYHKIEGEREVHWAGPSLGADVGGSGGQTFILVYNLYDTADLFHRYAQGEGQAYLLAGFNISELRRGNVVLIPVRMGAGLRLGVNLGYVKFTKKSSLFPF